MFTLFVCIDLKNMAHLPIVQKIRDHLISVDFDQQEMNQGRNVIAFLYREYIK